VESVVDDGPMINQYGGKKVQKTEKSEKSQKTGN
jgi:hypothetical protein